MAVPDGITLTLAVIGTAGTVAQVYTTFRDRPRSRFDAHTTTTLGQAPALTVTVFNVGTRPTTVREIGFYAHKSPVVIESQTQGTLHGEAELGGSSLRACSWKRAKAEASTRRKRFCNRACGPTSHCGSMPATSRGDGYGATLRA